MQHFNSAINSFNLTLILLSCAFFASLGKKLNELDMVDSAVTAGGLVGGIILIGFGLEDLSLGWDLRYTIKDFQLTISDRDSLAIILLSLFYLCCGFLAGWIKENRKRQEEGEEKITYRDFISKHKFFFINLYSVIGLILLAVWFYLQRYAIIQTF